MEEVFKETCLEIEKKLEIRSLEIGKDKDHMYLLTQSVPIYSSKKIIQVIKSVTARKIFAWVTGGKKKLWSGGFRTDEYYIRKVGQHSSEKTVRRYIKEQGIEKKYKRLHYDKPLNHILMKEKKIYFPVFKVRGIFV